MNTIWLPFFFSMVCLLIWAYKRAKKRGWSTEKAVKEAYKRVTAIGGYTSEQLRAAGIKNENEDPQDSLRPKVKTSTINPLYVPKNVELSESSMKTSSTTNDFQTFNESQHIPVTSRTHEKEALTLKLKAESLLLNERSKTPQNEDD